MIVVNPNGNGLTNGNLALATATAAQVLSGYTFYAGDKELKTGTLVPTPKVKTGSIGEIEPEQSITINCGFSPKIVVVYGKQDSRHPIYATIAFWYEGSSYLVSYNYFPDVQWENMEVIISVSKNSFTVYNPEIGSAGSSFNPFSYQIEIIDYIAIG